MFLSEPPRTEENLLWHQGLVPGPSKMSNEDTPSNNFFYFDERTHMARHHREVSKHRPTGENGMDVAE